MSNLAPAAISLVALAMLAAWAIVIRSRARKLETDPKATMGAHTKPPRVTIIINGTAIDGTWDPSKQTLSEYVVEKSRLATALGAAFGGGENQPGARKP